MLLGEQFLASGASMALSKASKHFLESDEGVIRRRHQRHIENCRWFAFLKIHIQDVHKEGTIVPIPVNCGNPQAGRVTGMLPRRWSVLT